MNCVELQQSLGESEEGSKAEQQAHLKTCTECSALLAEMKLIAASAKMLQAADEPSPRVWNSIEIALRREGLIRPPRPSRSFVPSFSSSSSGSWTRWLVPVAAALVITMGVYLRQHSASQQLASNAAPAVASRFSPDVSDSAIAGLNDDDLLQEVSELPAATQAQYADNLRSVNEYIRDAKSNVADDPNDEEARRSLLEAYQQKAMLFDLAMDRSLP